MKSALASYRWEKVMRLQDETTFAVGVTAVLGVLGIGLILPSMSDLWMAVTAVAVSALCVMAFGGWLCMKIMREITTSRRQIERVEALMMTGAHLRRVK